MKADRRDRSQRLRPTQAGTAGAKAFRMEGRGAERRPTLG